MTARSDAEIKALCEAATPGPWSASHRSSGRGPLDDETGGLGLDIEGPPEPQLRGQFARGADASFVAAARDLVPALLARAQRAEAALAEVRRVAANLLLFDALDFIDQDTGKSLIQGVDVVDDYEEGVHFAASEMRDALAVVPSQDTEGTE